MAHIGFTNRDNLVDSHGSQVSPGISYFSSIPPSNQGAIPTERCRGIIQCRAGHCGDYCPAVIDILHL
jgi:hypothetical protein